MSDARRGQMLVETTGIYQQDKMIDQLDVIAWLQENRAAISECKGCKLIPHEMKEGVMVCPLKYEECDRDESN